MRRLLAVVSLIGLMSDAFAGELNLPPLRGSEPVVPLAPIAPAVPVFPRWGGFYVGGHVGGGVANMDFTKATQPLVAHMLRDLQVENENRISAWEVLGKADTRSASAGAFVGYNNTWEGMIIGVDFTWSKTDFSADAPSSPITRATATSSGIVYATTLTGAGRMQISDFGTLRVRAGVDLGNVLPYAGIGVAVGRAGIFRSATASGVEIAPNPPNPPIVTPFFFTESETKNNAVIYGWSLSGGLDVMLLPNVFVRGEFEFVSFTSLWDSNAATANGATFPSIYQTGIRSSISTGRLGLAYKF